METRTEYSQDKGETTGFLTYAHLYSAKMLLKQVFSNHLVGKKQQNIK